jgi:hypothetical protein
LPSHLIFCLSLIRPPKFSSNYQQSHIVAEQEKLGEEITGEFCQRSTSFISVGFFFKYRKISRHGADGFTFSPKKVVLRIFIALKNPSSSAVFEHTNLASSGKHVTARPQTETYGKLISTNRTQNGPPVSPDNETVCFSEALVSLSTCEITRHHNPEA